MYNPTGEFKCEICHKWTADEDYNWQGKSICYNCYQAMQEETEMRVDEFLLEEG